MLIPRPGVARVEAAELSGRLIAFHRTFAVERIGKLTFVVTCHVAAGGHRRLALEQFLIAGCPRTLAERGISGTSVAHFVAGLRRRHGRT